MRPLLPLCILIVMTVSTALAETTYKLPLWDGTPPNHKASDLKETVFKRGADHDLDRIAYVQDPTIEVRLPSPQSATGQAVVICPGGGYTVLAYDWEGVDTANYLNAHGIAAIILKYRLPEDASNEVPHLSPLLDTKRALRLTRFHAKDWRIDPKRVGIMGFSAGGHAASTLGTHFDAGDPEAADPVDRLSSRPDFMALIYPVITMDSDFTHGGSRNNLIGKSPSADLIELYSNEKQVSPETPPTFLVHSADDKSVPVQNSLAFYQALLANGVDAEMHLYPYGGHGYSLAIGRGHLSDWPARCVAWMKSLESE
ncbi:alpha/beta hydrolase [Pelagicoccus sp. SDUM812005]|uniref:alpha/beta hydrolase n=1 Tax=Pelagicoccus sp. SDUM812005 TaxID=3041257 RepID=UPI00280D8AF3|nr:alpha/beta hydrolase [Pelagicoccus sp. SDUM812005]MDQ8179541.1 alpha/beta hydrolase [Pelagicoccus sp. SDUM812005]